MTNLDAHPDGPLPGQLRDEVVVAEPSKRDENGLITGVAFAYRQTVVGTRAEEGR